MKILLTCLMLFAAAPAFATEDLTSVYTPYSSETEKVMTSPHRGISELGAWLSETVASTLQFVPGKSAQKLTEVRPLFTEQGYKSYTDFLAQMGYGPSLQNQSLNLSSIVNLTPLLIGQGASAGRYAWAYEMQIVLSAGPAGQQANKSVTLRIQIGRNPNAANPMGVLMESWQIFQEPPNASGQPGGNP